jgi:RNA recognition motif-containing protein
VGNLSNGIGKADLEQLFTPYGGVVSAQVIVDRETQRSKGFGFVEMASDAQAQAAISALNGKSVEGRALTVNEARPQEQRNGGAYAGARRPGGTRGPYGTGRGGSGGAGRY